MQAPSAGLDAGIGDALAPLAGTSNDAPVDPVQRVAAVSRPGDGGNAVGTGEAEAEPALPPSVLSDLKLPFSIGLGAGSSHGAGCTCQVCQSWAPALSAVIKSATSAVVGTAASPGSPVLPAQREAGRAGYSASAAGSRVNTSA
jgi:hypothetical protein